MGSTRAEAERPTTLIDAHRYLQDREPVHYADPEDWLAHHEFAEKVYREVSQQDTRHANEALSWATYESMEAERLRRRMAAWDEEDRRSAANPAEAAVPPGEDH